MSPRVSLDQWLTFKTVVDEGSFALAAEALNKSQSAVSYAIQRLNELLPRPVLTLVGRKAELTEEGRVLYRHAEQLIKQAHDAEAVAASLAMDFEAEVVVALDSLVNMEQVICAFEKFSAQFPHTRLRVLETTLSGTHEALLEKQADVVLGARTPPGYRSKMLFTVAMIPVTSPGHPLHQLEQVNELDLRGHRQAVLRDTGSRREQDAGWLDAEKRWTVSHFSSSIKLLKSGLAFAFLPANWIQEELAAGTLKEIPLQQSMSRTIPIYLMLSQQQSAGPATQGLAQLIAEEVTGKPTA